MLFWLHIYIYLPAGYVLRIKVVACAPVALYEVSLTKDNDGVCKADIDWQTPIRSESSRVYVHVPVVCAVGHICSISETFRSSAGQYGDVAGSVTYSGKHP